MVRNSKDHDMQLAKIPYNHFLVCFNKNELGALINSENKVNVITPIYVSKIGIQVYYINIED